MHAMSWGTNLNQSPCLFSLFDVIFMIGVFCQSFNNIYLDSEKKIV